MAKQNKVLAALNYASVGGQVFSHVRRAESLIRQSNRNYWRRKTDPVPGVVTMDLVNEIDSQKV